MRTWAGVLGLCLLSIAFSWPWADLGGSLPARQFDLYGVLWLLDHARDVLPHLRSPVSDLPFGEDLRRLDTWVVLLLGVVFRPLFAPERIAQGIVLFGPVLGAIAAERCAALGLGVRRPWSWIAGVVYAFNGLGATSLLEGHVYYLLDPWLPLLTWALLAGTGPGGRVRHGVGAGAAWGLALATSAYVGLAGAILAVVLLGRGIWVRVDRRPVYRTAFGALLVAFPVFAAWFALFRTGSGGAASDPATVLAGGSATLATLATWSPSVDLANHSIAAPLGFCTLALIAAAPVVLRAEAGWRTFAALALGSVLLALGPAVQVGLGGIGTWYWVDLRGAPSAFGFLHFPVRLLWIWYLCAGLVASRVAERLAERAGNRALSLLLVVTADALFTTAVPWRIGTVPAATPSAYTHYSGNAPILDLLPEDPHPGSGLDLWVRRLACWYQVSHQHPIPGRCLGPHGATPQESAERAFREALLDGADPLPSLATLNVGAVAVHVDLFSPGDRDRVLTGLRAALGAPVESDDAGETIALFVVRTSTPDVIGPP